MLAPMLASLADAPLADPALVYEPKYDGIRAIVEIGAGGSPVKLWSRLGNDKTRQFPEIAEALTTWAATRREPLILDGEIVALDADGRPAGFQNLQGRIHIKDIVNARRSHHRAPRSRPVRPTVPTSPPATAFIAFDLLRDGAKDVRDRPLTERREALERIFGNTRSTILRLSDQVRGDGRALMDQARAERWEGLIAKRADSRYRSGARTPDWRKLKILYEQEFVVGGWTEPRQSRSHFGALLLGIYDDQGGARRERGGSSSVLTYVGHVGTGFSGSELERLMKLLKPLEVSTPPFANQVPTNERPHWATPVLVAQVRFTEWTADGHLRHPVYLGLRDDKTASSVRREHATPKVPAGDLIERLTEIEKSRKDAVIELPDGGSLTITNLHKVFWPRLKYTKGDLFRYYAAVAPALLPTIADRPLVMKRFPNGVAAKPFYQHRAEEAPPGVRIEPVGTADQRSQIIGGDVTTLMYTTQLAAISQDPWFSRVQSPADADYVAIDLDPPAGSGFGKVLDVARWVRDELDALGGVGFAKTSGADGMHVYIPLPAGTPYEAGLLFAQILATVVAQKHPKHATVERAVQARGSRIYVDYLQNIQGKTLASAYSARASDYAGVSTPLDWKEVDAGVRREDFTIKTVPDRLRAVGDLWAPLGSSKGMDLSRVADYTGLARNTRSAHKPRRDQRRRS